MKVLLRIYKFYWSNRGLTQFEKTTSQNNKLII